MEIAAWWAFLVVVWIASLNSFSIAELVAAALFAVPGAFAARAGRRAAGVRWRLPSGWFRWLLTLPVAIAHDVVAVLVLAVRPRSREGDDEFRPLPLPDEPTEACRAGREAMTTVILSSTPGSVVVDANAEHDELLVHTLPVGDTALERQVRR
ncbi:MAG TPA: Na+/H+ antiporter subunit E [Pseudonocardiaceae bacterium]|jgi:multisubunit Na+/H+ antiporter MnhE subunit|nr:Na+/H+ antiporter subunit E [Pseudonocardiaceae bacterium]